MTYNFVVYSNEMACRKKGRLGLDPVHIGIRWIDIPFQGQLN